MLFYRFFTLHCFYYQAVSLGGNAFPVLFVACVTHKMIADCTPPPTSISHKNSHWPLV